MCWLCEFRKCEGELCADIVGLSDEQFGVRFDELDEYLEDLAGSSEDEEDSEDEEPSAGCSDALPGLSDGEGLIAPQEESGVNNV